MAYPSPFFSVGPPWVLFVAYWTFKASRTRETQRKEPFTSRYGVMLILIVGYVCIFSSRGAIGVLGWRFVPATTDVALLGVIVTWLGIALAIWARYHLGEYWSARVTIKQGHELIRTGPYTRFRHPIYSGLFLATLGSAVAIGEWRCLLGVALVLIAYTIKAKREEAMLTEQFREAFAEHRRHTGFLLPKLR
jgi:protein-S-isoprenylcysteine O-methyltransferase Ste14